MLGLNSKLALLEEEGNPIRIGLVGVGQMGEGVINVASKMKGIRVAITVNRNVERARQAFIRSGICEDAIVSTDSPKKAREANARGQKVITDSLDILVESDFVDVVLEATGIPEVGAEAALRSILNGKHVVTMNVEADVTVGRILNRLARGVGVVYTLAAGDEPGALKELYDFADALGFDILVAGKGKNNPLDRKATPESLVEIAEKKGVNPRMLCEFVDGTKSMVEMCCFANATGLVPDVIGMHGPRADLRDLLRVFSLKKDGGILNRTGVVDYAIGDVAPGVFLIVTTDNDKIHKDLQYLRIGDGPNYLLYRPYHLTNIEAPLSVARAVIYGEPTLVPRDDPVAEVLTVAKRPLRSGERIDGMGMYTVYGSITTYEEAKRKNYLPIGLSGGATLTEDVDEGEIITLDQVKLKESTLLHLRRLQDSLAPRVGGSPSSFLGEQTSEVKERR
ncbi:MAG: NAD(P)H-dependent oxidoreductase [bacterium]